MNEEAIERFFNKQCTAQEAKAVSEYLKDNPAALEKYLNEREWFISGSAKMPEAFWDESWKEITRKPPVRMMTIAKRVAVAAAVILASGITWNALQTREKPAIAAVVGPMVTPTRKITVNNTSEPMVIALNDSSRVILSPGSLISYAAPFADVTREVTLDGQARFIVTKHSAKPFTVFAGGLATTALGTEFTIDTRNKLSVKLHHGKVLITATGLAMKHWKKDVILEPGQQLNYDSSELTAVVTLSKTDKVIARTRKSKDRIKEVSSGPGLDFVSSPLPDVLDRLMNYYHQPIRFDSADVSDMNFTGTISEKDSLSVVLQAISQMNSLRLERTDDGYHIRRLEK